MQEKKVVSRMIEKNDDSDKYMKRLKKELNMNREKKKKQKSLFNERID